MLLAATTAPALGVLAAGDAKALLVYEITQKGPDIELIISGSLSGIGSGGARNTTIGGIDPRYGIIGTRDVNPGRDYRISGPASFGTGIHRGYSVYTGDTLALWPAISALYLSASYVEGDSINGSGIIPGLTLASMGLTKESGLLGEWTIGSDRIEVWAGAKPTANSVPGPLPLLGAAAAFSYSRNIRSRYKSRVPRA